MKQKQKKIEKPKTSDQELAFLEMVDGISALTAQRALPLIPTIRKAKK